MTLSVVHPREKAAMAYKGVKGRPHTKLVQLSVTELALLQELAAKSETSGVGVIRAALRFYAQNQPSFDPAAFAKRVREEVLPLAEDVDREQGELDLAALLEGIRVDLMPGAHNQVLSTERELEAEADSDGFF
jgi:hypothetical protein